MSWVWNAMFEHMLACNWPLEVCYDLDIKSYDDLPVWAYESLNKIHFFVNSFRDIKLWCGGNIIPLLNFLEL
jgi:hypothetical protein